MRRYGYDFYQYLIFAHKDLTEEYFVSKSGVLDGYCLLYTSPSPRDRG